MTAFVISGILLAFWLLQFGMGLAGSRSVLRPARGPEPGGPGLPTLSVIFAARDEAAAVEAATRSLLDSRYPALEIVAVDDRSSDGTGGILDRLATEAAGRDGPRLRVVHASDPPPGWLGKNRALWLGASLARGRWLLFTDADVLFRADALSRAVATAEAAGLDHLTLAPRFSGGRLFVGAVEGALALLMGVIGRVSRVPSPRSSAYFGIGAFNLVRADAYRRAGTHEAIALRPDDDAMLGKLMKRRGFRSAVGVAGPLLAVSWYASVGDMARGLEKNALSPVGYRPSLAAAASLGALALYEGPFVATALAQGPARAMAALAAVLALTVYVGVNAESGASPWTAWLFPLAEPVLVAIYLRAVLLAARRGAIQWRGRSYPLAELRRNNV